MTRVIVHVDMDAFYAAVEQRDDPQLRGRPVLVGGSRHRGVVAAASYEARSYGVHSAMPMAQALRLCPQAVVCPGRHERYAQVSAAVFEIFHRYTPLVEGLSLDEAFLDVTDSRRLRGSGPEIARKIKADIAATTGLTASAGVAPVKFVAKIASDLEKPNGLVIVAAAAVEGFLAPLPIERMWGIGKVSARRLHDAGYETLGDLAGADPSALRTLLGAFGLTVSELARGVDPRPVSPEREAKSIGSEETYDIDLCERRAIERELLRHAERVANRLIHAGVRARAVTVKLKDHAFHLHTAHERLAAAAQDTPSLYRAACAALDRLHYDGTPMRLVGLAASDLGEHDAQGELFPDAELARRARLEETVVAANDRFGAKALGRAATWHSKGPGSPNRRG